MSVTGWVIWASFIWTLLSTGSFSVALASIPVIWIVCLLVKRAWFDLKFIPSLFYGMFLFANKDNEKATHKVTHLYNKYAPKPPEEWSAPPTPRQTLRPPTPRRTIPRPPPNRKPIPPPPPNRKIPEHDTTFEFMKE